MASSQPNASVNSLVPVGAAPAPASKLNPRAEIFGPSNQFVYQKANALKARAGNAVDPVACRLQFGDLKVEGQYAKEDAKQGAGNDKGKGKQKAVDDDVKVAQVAGLADPFGDDKSDNLSAVGQGRKKNISRRHLEYNNHVGVAPRPMANGSFQQQFSELGATMPEPVYMLQPKAVPGTMLPNIMMPPTILPMVPFGAVPSPTLFHFVPHQSGFIPGPDSVPVAGGVMVPGMGPISPSGCHYHFLPNLIGIVPPVATIEVPFGFMVPILLLPGPGPSDFIPVLNYQQGVDAYIAGQYEAGFHGPYASQWEGPTTHYPLNGAGTKGKHVKNKQNSKRARVSYRIRENRKEQPQDALSIAHRSQHQQLHPMRSNPKFADGQRQERNTILPSGPVQEAISGSKSALDAAVEPPVDDDFGYSKAEHNWELFDISAAQDSILEQMRAAGEPLPGSVEFHLEMAAGLAKEVKREQEEQVASWMERIHAEGGELPTTPPLQHASISDDSSPTPVTQVAVSWDDQVDTDFEESVGTSSPIKAGGDVLAQPVNNNDQYPYDATPEADGNNGQSLYDATPKAVQKGNPPTPEPAVAEGGMVSGTRKKVVEDGSDVESTSTVVAAEDLFVGGPTNPPAMSATFGRMLVDLAKLANKPAIV